MKLPLNCTVEYIRQFLSKEECQRLYQHLTNDYHIAALKTALPTEGEPLWSDYGKLMFMDQDLYEANKLPEEFWGKTTVWSDELLKVKRKVEAITNKAFHVCVCIYYPDGYSGVEYHTDYVAYGDTNLIPSLSIGEERVFSLRENSSSEEYQILLEEGSLLIMGDHCQQRYEHSLPVDPKYKNGRINLTFRRYGFET